MGGREQWLTGGDHGKYVGWRATSFTVLSYASEQALKVGRARCGFLMPAEESRTYMCRDLITHIRNENDHSAA